MGCRLVTSTAHAREAPLQDKPESMHLTARPSSDDDELPLNREEPEDEADPTRIIPTKTEVLSDTSEPKSSSSTLSLPPRTITSQLSDIVDMCEGMEVEELQTKTELVLERILRAQYQLEQLGSAATPETVSRVDAIDARFQDFLKKNVGEQDDASLSAAHDVLVSIDSDLDTVSAQLHPT